MPNVCQGKEMRGKLSFKSKVRKLVKIWLYLFDLSSTTNLHIIMKIIIRYYITDTVYIISKFWSFFNEISDIVHHDRPTEWGGISQASPWLRAPSPDFLRSLACCQELPEQGGICATGFLLCGTGRPGEVYILPWLPQWLGAQWWHSVRTQETFPQVSVYCLPIQVSRISGFLWSSGLIQWLADPVFSKEGGSCPGWDVLFGYD